MQKKSLDVNIGVQDYNKKIFNKSMELIINARKVSVVQIANSDNIESIKHKCSAIDDKLINMLKILRKFTHIQPSSTGPIDLAQQILQQLKLQTKVKIRKINEQKNTLKRAKVEQSVKKLRPQDQYKDIKTYQNFDDHTHQQYFSNGIIPQLKICQVVQQPSNIQQSYVYVDTVEKLNAAIEQMKQCKQLAVDVEHSMKSYEGFTCLIQISTRIKDYIIDVFPIWSSIPALQTVIGDPNIIKVMHGAEMDTKWLQRDFNIHIVNLFDTHKAARILGLQRFSYAHILHHYCGVTANKQFQRADWRQRPLSSDMIKYARCDTHYLLTIFDYVRMDLQKLVKSMNLSITETFRDLQKNSHIVTLQNAQLFSYKTKQLYMTLQQNFQNKKEQFKAIQAIFSQLNYAAAKQDQNFDDLILRKDLSQAFSIIKDLTFNKSSKISKQSRIQKVVSILQRGNNRSLVSPIENIKASLVQIFCNNSGHVPNKNSQKIISKVNYQQKILPQYRTQEQKQIQTFVRLKNNQIKFEQLKDQSFKVVQKNPKTKVTFGSIFGFLSQKYGVKQIKQQQGQNRENNEIEEENSYEQSQQNDKQQDDKKGMIQFKRMNPNVIYVVEQPDPQVEKAMKSQQPRKIKKQTQFENRIRNKAGNIYDMLGDN